MISCDSACECGKRMTEFTVTFIVGERSYPRRALDDAAKAWGEAEVIVRPTPKPKRRLYGPPMFGGSAPGARIPQYAFA